MQYSEFTADNPTDDADGTIWVDIFTDKEQPQFEEAEVAGDIFTYEVTSTEGCYKSPGVNICSGGGTTIGDFSASADKEILSLPDGVAPPAGCGVGDTVVPGTTCTYSLPGTIQTQVVSGTEDTDLSGGLWVYVPDTATSLNDYEFGVFADGSEPFMKGNIDGLTGTADYKGGAYGVYSVEAAQRNYFFDADASLEAEFGDDVSPGTVSGTISGFDFGTTLLPPLPRT